MTRTLALRLALPLSFPPHSVAYMPCQCVHAVLMPARVGVAISICLLYHHGADSVRVAHVGRHASPGPQQLSTAPSMQLSQEESAQNRENTGCGRCSNPAGTAQSTTSPFSQAALLPMCYVPMCMCCQRRLHAVLRTCAVTSVLVACKPRRLWRRAATRYQPILRQTSWMRQSGFPWRRRTRGGGVWMQCSLNWRPLD